jgi:hypothetical protein
MQHRQEQRPLHRDLEPPLAQQLFDHFPATGLVPQAFEDLDRTDASGRELGQLTLRVRRYQQHCFGEAGSRLEQGVELTRIL